MAIVAEIMTESGPFLATVEAKGDVLHGRLVIEPRLEAWAEAMRLLGEAP